LAPPSPRARLFARRRAAARWAVAGLGSLLFVFAGCYHSPNLRDCSEWSARSIAGCYRGDLTVSPMSVSSVSGTPSRATTRQAQAAVEQSGGRLLTLAADNGPHASGTNPYVIVIVHLATAVTTTEGEDLLARTAALQRNIFFPGMAHCFMREAPFRLPVLGALD
jgi:hypothetical protein